jgi:hypothetical protein
MSIKNRLTRLERQQGQQEVSFVLEEGPPMSPEEIDAYNATRGPDDSFLFTLRIDRREDAPALVVADGEAEA